MSTQLDRKKCAFSLLCFTATVWFHANQLILYCCVCFCKEENQTIQLENCCLCVCVCVFLDKIVRNDLNRCTRITFLSRQNEIALEYVCLCVALMRMAWWHGFYVGFEWMGLYIYIKHLRLSLSLSLFLCVVVCLCLTILFHCWMCSFYPI